MAPTPFDLTRALLGWRSRMSAAGPCRAEDVDEMETHLRDSTAALEARGLTTEEAFLVATRRLGREADLALEIAKVHPAEVFRTRAIWMLVGILVFGFVGDVARVSSNVFVLGSRWLGADSLWLGWIGILGALLPVVAGAVIFAGFARGRRFIITPRATDRFRHHALRASLVLGALLAARVAALTFPIAIARELDPSALGHLYLVRGYGLTVGGFIFVLLAATFLQVLLQRGTKAWPASTAL
ncbi:MAG: hypothetical protein JNK85_29780, partial [Verrucomicrobiales bacterium]|nr:hypothetical protein [Verrucomicrobiales bacterium]